MTLRRTFFGKLARAVLASAATLYVSALAALWLAQRHLMYFPNKVEVAPAASGLAQAERIHLTTGDGETLLAWYVAPRPGRPLIIHFHGNGGGMAQSAARFAAFAAAGIGVLAVEYRGYAGSTGTPTEAGLLADGEAAWNYAIGTGMPPARIVLMGESLGTGVAVALAARHPAAAVILDSPYSSTADVAAATYWMFPVHALMSDTFLSSDRIRHVTAPLLIVHGTDNTIIPIRFGQKLFSFANAPKEFVTVSGAGHLAMGLCLPQVLAWIDRTLH